MLWMLLYPETPPSTRYVASSAQDLWNQTRLFGPDSVWLGLYSIIYVKAKHWRKCDENSNVINYFTKVKGTR